MSLHHNTKSLHQPLQKGLLHTKIQSFKAHSVPGPPPKSVNDTDNNKLCLKGPRFKALFKNKNAVMNSLHLL